jgi:YHS domain-containing protein
MSRIPGSIPDVSAAIPDSARGSFARRRPNGTSSPRGARSAPEHRPQRDPSGVRSPRKCPVHWTIFLGLMGLVAGTAIGLRAQEAAGPRDTAGDVPSPSATPSATSTDYGPPLPDDIRAALEARSGPTRALRIEQRASGIPDADAASGTKSVLQAITVASDRERLILEQFTASAEAASASLESRTILRLDRQPIVAWELGPDGKSYREHEGDLNRIQKDRDVREAELRRRAERLSRAEAAEVLARNHIRADGQREVRIEWLETAEILGRPSKRLRVDENGRTIIDAFIAVDEVEGRSLFDLYRRLGAFSEEVLEAIRDIEGLPIRGSISVVTKLTVHVFEFEVTKIESVDVAAESFDLPEGAKEIIDTPDVVRCPVCQKDVETAGAERWPYGGRTYWFCSTTCRDAFKKSVFQRGTRP